MKILAIETSCDETAVAVLEAEDTPPLSSGVSFYAHANIVHSQVELHAEYGGVYPTIAKREHSRNLVPILDTALQEAASKISNDEFLISNQFQNSKFEILNSILEREPELAEALIAFLKKHPEKPNIDAIAVTHAPGLEPALWVGINFAKALAIAWELPLLPINHMEGHFVSALLKQNDPASYELPVTDYPILALLVSGGHTELVLSRDWLQYELIGETRDDAAGEAFDKVARLLGLSYPGGPAIAREAEKYEKLRVTDYRLRITDLPRPMIDSDDFDFSFSGLKTAVRYRAEQMAAASPTGALDENVVRAFTHEFQEAVTDVLVSKTIRAATATGAKTIAVGGGVSANERLREKLAEAARELPDTELCFAPRELTGDNALMIAATAYLRAKLRGINEASVAPNEIAASGTRRIMALN